MHQTKIILIISEEMNFYQRLKKGLSADSYILVTALSTDYNLKNMIEQLSPDIIVIDPAPPNLKGIELSLQVRSWSPVPILLCSIWNTSDSEIRILDVHSEGWLSEPLAVSLIAVRIDDLLAKPIA